MKTTSQDWRFIDSLLMTIVLLGGVLAICEIVLARSFIYP